MRLKSALRRGVAAAVIAGIVVSSGIPVYAKTWDIASGDITVKGASDESGNYNEVKQGDKGFEKDEGETVITGKSKEHTVTIDTSKGNVDVTFDDLKIDVSGKAEVDGSGKAEHRQRSKNSNASIQNNRLISAQSALEIMILKGRKTKWQRQFLKKWAALMYGKGIILSPALLYQPKKKTSLSVYGGIGINAICKNIKEQPILLCSQAASWTVILRILTSRLKICFFDW